MKQCASDRGVKEMGKSKFLAAESRQEKYETMQKLLQDLTWNVDIFKT